ncbi:MAG: ATP-binding protein [Melioribacteraceae bacterium]
MNRDIERVTSLEVEKDTELVFSFEDVLGTSKIDILKHPMNGDLTLSFKKVAYKPKEKFIGEDFFTYINDKGLSCLVALSIKDSIFKPRARLLIQLGDQLIKNESIALIELAKNSFDADAGYCNVTMKNIEDKHEGKIVVEDDGFGMDIETVKTSWLEPGSDNKETILKEKKVTPKYKRLPIGEKGIGRFGVHKLGKKIEMVSRKEGNKEVVVRIDWEEFEKYKYLNDAPVELFERDPEIFKGDKTGTKIIISSLTKNWTRGMVRDVFRALNGISTPPTYDIDDIINPNLFSKLQKREVDSFEAKLITDRIEWIKDIPSWNEILEYSLFFFDIEIENDRILSFRYKFKPLENFSDLKGRVITHNDAPIKGLLDISDPDIRKYRPLELEGLKIGRFQFKGCIFIRDSFIFKLLGIQSKSFTEYLNKNGGIRVYRNGVRVYDYGEQENDWLSLDYRRFNNPGVKLSNNLMLASINLNREVSSDLIEKTNREGFINNKAYEVFKKQITYSLKLVELLRLEDKRKIDDKYRAKKDSEPVLKSIEGLRSIVSEKVKDKKIQKEIEVYVDRIEKNYRFMNDTLIKSASAGLGWSVYVHEIEKIIAEIIKVLKQDKASERMMKLTTHLSELIESYAQILRKTTKSSQDLSKVVDQALFNVEYRLNAHNIKIDRSDLQHVSENVTIARNLLVSTIMNLIDNSIYWLDRAQKKNKIIRFDIAELFSGYISLVILDNGTGFTLPPEQMIEPFVSAKPGGMGMGLHIVSEVMASHKGLITFNEDGNYEVPNSFSEGAIVILSFKK